MRRSPWLILPVALVCLGSFAPAQDALDEATAQKLRQSHTTLPPLVEDPERAQQFLAQRLRRAQDNSGLEKLIQDKDSPLRQLIKEVIKDPEKYGLDRETILDLARNGAPKLDDPKGLDLARKVIENNKDIARDLKISPEQIEEWKKLLDPNLGKLPPDLRPGIDPPMPPRPGMPPFQPPQPLPPPNMPRPPADFKPAPPAKEPGEWEKWIMREGLKMSKKARNWDFLQKNPSVQKAIRDLNRAIYNRDPNAAPDAGSKAKGLADYLPKLDALMPKDGGKSLWPDLSKVTLPNTPVGNWQAPRIGAPDLRDGSTWEPILWTVVLVGFAFAAWGALAWKQKRAAQQPAWRLGPWPVNPARISTRDDLIRAFEYLSLLLFGRDARTWNHVDIAGRIGEEKSGTPEHRQAARHLAWLYEQARYAPLTAPLPEAEMEAARRDLCLLAGVAA